jgi:putative flavoprotein involved in K+ transport
MADPVEVLVVGAGQAGLAASYWLHRYGVEHLVVDRGSGFGESWRSRWDSLQMITPNWMNGLPGSPYPGPPDAFAPRTATVDYLRRYGETVRAPVWWRTPVVALRAGAAGLLAETPRGPVPARNAIVATGPYQVPRIPAAAAGLVGVVQLHSSGYRVPDQLPAGEVLVVGSGNSGVAIAIELARDRDVVLACGSNPRVPRRVSGRRLIRTMGAIAAQQLAVPPDAADREADLMRWLDEVGFYEMAADTPLGARLSAATSDAYCGPPLEEVAAAHGIRLTGRVEVAGGRPVSSDGETLAPRAVVWATGYRHDFGWLRAPVLDPGGVPRHTRGVTAVPGLYFLGLRFLHTASSSLLYGVGRDARHLVEHIRARGGGR